MNSHPIGRAFTLSLFSLIIDTLVYFLPSHVLQGCAHLDQGKGQHVFPLPQLSSRPASPSNYWPATCLLTQKTDKGGKVDFSITRLSGGPKMHSLLHDSLVALPSAHQS